MTRLVRYWRGRAGTVDVDLDLARKLGEVDDPGPAATGRGEYLRLMRENGVRVRAPGFIEEGLHVRAPGLIERLRRKLS